MTRHLVGVAALVVLLTGLPAGVVDGAESGVLGERFLGRADAPVTIEEFSSLTCPHCATFHAETLPQIKKDYIDTGKVRLVFTDFPLDQLALAAALVARCMPEKRYFGFLEALFSTQRGWASSPRPLDDIGRLARMGGMTDQQVAACLDNQALLQAIQNKRTEAHRTYDIRSTPTFVIAGEKVSGAMPYEQFRAVIDRALEAAR